MGLGKRPRVALGNAEKNSDLLPCVIKRETGATGRELSCLEFIVY